MSSRRVALVDRMEAAGATGGATAVVLDPAWTPGPGERADAIGLRSLVAPVLDRGDLLEETFQRLDEWAELIELPRRMTADGFSWWYGRRQWLWLWLAERAHWLAILDELMRMHGPFEELDLELGAADPALADAVRWFADARGITASVPPAVSPPGETHGSTALSLAERVQWRLGRHPRLRRKRELEARDAVLDARLASIAAGPSPRVIVLSNPTVHQVVSIGGQSRRRDAFLGSTIDRLRETGIAPIVVHLGARRSDDARWEDIRSDASVLPGWVATSHAPDPDDDRTAAGVAHDIEGALAEIRPVPLSLERVDVGAKVLELLRHYAATGLPRQIVVARRAARLIRTLEVDGMVLINEYGVPEWIAAARHAGVPSVAVQHGVIVPAHVGYRHRRADGLPIPDLTCVFGEYEARVLREHGGYRSEQVTVTGAPRLDRQGGDPGADERTPDERERERQAVRATLGVAEGDRLLVISTTNETVHRTFYWPHALGRLLDGPLPRTHLVFKLHPVEADDGLYRRLVEGLARAGGWTPPPITVVSSIDLLSLLRAADAHLGLYSTVLTDAVAVGATNLIAATQARTDLVGYVDAGVARPVRTAAELRAALDHPQPADPGRRSAFLLDHFRPGDATGRIVEAVTAAIGVAT